MNALHPDVARALREAFGDAPIEGLEPVLGGRSGATLFSVRVSGTRYVVRRTDATRPSHEVRLALEMECLKVAAEHGVAPPLHYADPRTGVTITRYIDVVPRGRLTADAARRTTRIASTLRRLHHGPPFPKGQPFLRLLHHVNEILRAQGGEPLPPVLFDTLADLAAATERFATSAPCHGDLNPGNILEAEDAVYLVDWETASTSDPFLDLGQLGVFAFPTPRARDTLLEAYLERTPSSEERARAAIGHVMALGFYAAAFVCTMVLGKEGTRLEAEPVEPVPLLELLPQLAMGPVSSARFAASLLGEMRREADTESFREARLKVGGSAR